MVDRRARTAAAVVLCAIVGLAAGLVSPVQAETDPPGGVSFAEVTSSLQVTPETRLPKRPMIAPKGRQVNSKTAQRIRGRAVDLVRAKVKVEVKLYGKYRKGAKKKLLSWHKVKRVRTDAKGRYQFVFRAGGKKWWMRIWAPGDEYYRPTYARRVQTGFYGG